MKSISYKTAGWSKSILLIIGTLLALRFALSTRLPTYILANMPHDDAWVVTGARHILEGSWLGPYDQFTLIKGPFSPLLLAFAAYIGVPFAQLNTAFYCFACVVFVIAIRPIIRRPIPQMICLFLLLFNPIGFALETGQRVYRNGLGQWQILLVFACLIALYIRRNAPWKVILKWAVLGGIALATFVLTREDRVWIYPFVLSAIGVTICATVIDRYASLSKLVVFVLPIVIPAVGLAGASLINYEYYGTALINDRSGGNFAKVAEDLYGIRPNPAEAKIYESEKYSKRYYSIYASTMESAFANSPTLNSIAPSIRSAIKQWASWDDPDKTGQLPTDHMLFALRDGVKFAGYYHSLPETEDFYRRVHEELAKAFETGRLIRRGVSISPLIRPLQDGDIGKTLLLLPRALWDVARFKDVGSRSSPAIGSNDGISTFARLAGGEYFITEGRLIGRGWAFAKQGNTQLTVGLYNRGGTLIANLPLVASNDVYQHMQSKGLEYPGAKLARFSFEIEGYNLASGVELRLLAPNGNVLRSVILDGKQLYDENSDSAFYLDELKTTSPSAIYEPYIERANRVTGFYQLLIPIVSFVSGVIYLYATYRLIIELRSGGDLKTLQSWIIMTGILFTLLLFMLIMCLITATSFEALIYIYTAPAYVLLLMWCVFSLCWGVETSIKFTSANNT